MTYFNSSDDQSVLKRMIKTPPPVMNSSVNESPRNALLLKGIYPQKTIEKELQLSVLEDFTNELQMRDLTASRIERRNS